MQRANYDGSGIQTLDSAATARHFYDVEVDVANDRVYWSRGNQVFRADLNGNNPVEITPPNTRWIVGLAIDTANDHLYYVEFNNEQIGRTNLDGDENQILIDRDDHPYPSIIDPWDIDIDFVNRQLYFHSEDNADHFRSDLDGPEFQFLFNGHESNSNANHQPVAVEVDPAANFMYWTE